MSPRRNPNPRHNPPEVEQGIARGIFVSVFAYEIGKILRSRNDARLRGIGIDKTTKEYENEILARTSETWDDIAPSQIPAWAFEAADALYELVEQVNDKPMAALVAEAEGADRFAIRRRPNLIFEIATPDEMTEGDYAWSFGYHVGRAACEAQFGEDTFRSPDDWFANHADFDLKIPAKFNAIRYYDGDLGFPV